MSKRPMLAFLVFLTAACDPPVAGPIGGDSPEVTKPRKDPPKGGDPDDSEGGGDVTGATGVYPTEAFTGFDGEHDFVLPIASIGGKATWTAKDASMVSLEQSDEGVKVKSKKAGSTTLTAKSGSKSFTVKLTITEYAPEAWTAGQRVYNETIQCKTCHVKKNAPDHSPSEIGKHEDAHIEQRVKTGESLHGEPPQANHKFADRLEDGDLEGVLAYLRALKPNGFPKEEHGHEHEHEEE
jgi:mono/diheme cytochrome c family protein